MNCPHCNHTLNENSKFCPECGTKLLEESTPPPIDTNTTVTDTNDNSNEVTETIPVSNETKPKKKKIAKIILISVLTILSIIIIFVILYIVNPKCMFYHYEHYTIKTEPTCTQDGSEQRICTDCGGILGIYTLNKKDHTWDTVSCDIEHTCLTCGTKEKLSHSENSDHVCRYCGQAVLSVTIKYNSEYPLIYEYDYTGKLSSVVSMSDPIITTYTDAFSVNYTMTKVYDKHGDSYSSRGSVGWKLYDSKGIVVNSSTGYSDGQIKVGETSEDLIMIQYLNKWEQYTLEFLNVS